jgi:hypothetical protein
MGRHAPPGGGLRDQPAKPVPAFVRAVRQSTFRLPLIAFALVNLLFLGKRLWPWSLAKYLPGNGTTALDPFVTLLVYIGLAFWISLTTKPPEERKSLRASALLGLVAGALLAVQSIIACLPPSPVLSNPSDLEYGLLAAAILVFAAAGARAVRAGRSPGFAALCAAWCGMIACQFPCAVYLVGEYFNLRPGQNLDSYQQFQNIAIGSEYTQALITELVTATGFLLIGPLVALVAGALAAALFKKPAPKKP